MRASWLTLLLVAGCATHPGPVVSPTNSASAVVIEFMRAVADSNLGRMSDLWGTSKGAASRTGNPPDYQRRLVVVQAYLRGGTSRVLSEDRAPGGGDKHLLVVELDRGGCTKQVPFTAVRATEGWLVNSIELNAAGNPMRPCDSRGSSD